VRSSNDWPPMKVARKPILRPARGRARLLAILLLPLILCAREASAHRDDYLNETDVYLTLERGELETEYWLDRVWLPAAEFNRHNAAVEWGITDHWMADARVTAISDGGTNFDSARVESRYRFFDEGVRPVDVAVSLELNTEREPDGSRPVGIEPRLILSRDVGEKLNFTANLSEEIPLDSGTPAFLGAFGTRLNWNSLVRVGSEFQYNFAEHTGSVIPQLWLTFRQDVTIKIGYAVGIDREPEDFARVALEVEF